MGPGVENVRGPPDDNLRGSRMRVFLNLTLVTTRVKFKKALMPSIEDSRPMKIQITSPMKIQIPNR